MIASRSPAHRCLYPVTSFKRRPRSIRCRVAVAELEVATGPRSPKVDPLPLFLNWSIQNGIQGVGSAGSKVALYETTTGDRGILCTQDVASGEELLNIPLRLALTDHPDDEESNALLYEGAPWSVRLSAKLLREYAKADQSPWWPYLQVLPSLVATPSETFCWEELQEIDYEPAKQAVYEYDHLMAESYKSCTPEALGGASEEDFKWAMSIVHSRTFGSASRKGGVGARMLVPLVDMLNHGGDEQQLDGQVLGADNVRWDLVPPATEDAKWCMKVTSTSEIYQGEQVVLSYGERSNDDFLVHYGFVPPRNAHDDVALFTDLEEALEWHYQQYNLEMPVNEAESRYRAALQAGLQEQQEQQQQQQQATAAAAAAAAATTAAGGTAPLTSQDAGSSAQSSAAAASTAEDSAFASSSSSSSTDSGTGLAVKPQELVKLMRGSRVSNPLMVAFSLAVGGNTRHAEAAVARRCQQMLQGFSRTYLQDLSLLARDAASVEGLDHDVAYYTELLNYYHNTLSSQHAVIAKKRAAADGGGVSEDSAAQAPAAAATATSASEAPASTSASEAPAGTRGGTRPQDILSPAMMAAAVAVAGEEAVAATASAATASGTVGQQQPPSSNTVSQVDLLAGLPAVHFTPQQRLAVRYLADKKRLMWDLLIAAGPTGF